MKKTISLLSMVVLLILCNKPVYASQDPFLEVSISEKKELLEKIIKINIGDSYQKVISTLGKPTSEQPLAQKGFNKIIGKEIVYSAVIWEQNLVNEYYDEYITIFLNEDNAVKNVIIKISLP